MTHLLKRYPFHSFLIGIYIISFIYVRNFTQLSVWMGMRSVVVSLLIAGFIFSVSYLLFRSSRKAGIFTTIFIAGFFTYGVVYEKLEELYFKGYWPLAHIHRFVILAYFIFFLVVFLIFFKSKRPHHNVNYTLNIFVLAVFLINAGIGVINSLGKKKEVDHNPFLLTDMKRGPASYKGSMPDVYYIILDGYARQDILRKYYGPQYDVLYDYLRAKGFYVADSSKCNYFTTVTSLSSSLNLDYIDLKKSNVNILLNENLVTYLFRQNKYRVVNIESGYAITHNLKFSNKTIEVKGLNEFETRLMELTVFRLDNVLGFTSFTRLKSQLGRLQLVTDEPGPKFSFIHIVAPHPPFVVDSNGKRVFRTSLSDMGWEPRKDYAEQLKYVSKRTIDFLEYIQHHSSVPPIIILQSDHGPWITHNDSRQVYDARAGILNAYKLPDTLKSGLYPSITPVNTFRLISSGLFGYNLPLLKDQPVNYDTMKKDQTLIHYTSD